jgi:molybdopterin molybdotransferase
MTSAVSYDEGLELALALGSARAMAAETVPLAAAAGRVAACEVLAGFDLPGFAASAMDGYAVAARDLPASGERRFTVTATVLAGGAPAGALGPGQAAAIMTGAPLPQGADTVVIREHARPDGDSVWLPTGSVPGLNVRAADDDCAYGARALGAGQVLTPARVALLAALGVGQVQVARRPRVAVLVTGDELVPGTGAPAPGLRRDSNGPLLAGLAAAAGADLVGHRLCRDEPAALRTALLELSGEADVVLSTGGISAGIADHLPGVIDAIARSEFRKLRMKPGMPVLLAQRADAVIFALPGNPVSAGVCFHVLVAPLLARMLGRCEPQALFARASLATAWSKNHARLEFLRVVLEVDGDGKLQATPLARQGSGMLSTLATATALARLEEGECEYPAGAIVDVHGIAPPWLA